MLRLSQYLNLYLGKPRLLIGSLVLIHICVREMNCELLPLLAIFYYVTLYESESSVPSEHNPYFTDMICVPIEENGSR